MKWAIFRNHGDYSCNANPHQKSTSLLGRVPAIKIIKLTRAHAQLRRLRTYMLTRKYSAKQVEYAIDCLEPTAAELGSHSFEKIVSLFQYSVCVLEASRSSCCSTSQKSGNPYCAKKIFTKARDTVCVCVRKLSHWSFYAISFLSNFVQYSQYTVVEVQIITIKRYDYLR